MDNIVENAAMHMIEMIEMDTEADMESVMDRIILMPTETI